MLKEKKWLMGNGHPLCWSPIKEVYIEDLSSCGSALLKDGLFGITKALLVDTNFFEGKEFVTSYEVYKRLPESLRERASFYLYKAKTQSKKQDQDLLVIDFHTKIDGEGGHIPEVNRNDYLSSPCVHLSVCGGATTFLAPIFNKMNELFDSPKLMSQFNIESLPSAGSFNCRVIKNPALQSKSAYETRLLELNAVFDDPVPPRAMEIARMPLSLLLLEMAEIQVLFLI